MTGCLTLGVDHVGLAVRDLDQALGLFARFSVGSVWNSPGL